MNGYLHWSRKFVNTWEMMDLVQEASIGLMRAVDHYNYALGLRFSTYATWWIRQGIVRAIGNYSLPIRLPIHVFEPLSPALRQLRHWPTSFEDRVAVLQEAGIDTELAEQVAVTLFPISMDGITRLEAAELPDTTTEEAEEQVRLAEVLDQVLGPDTLPARERRVIECRFGLADQPEMSLQAIGDELGLTRERVRQLEAKALQRLRKPSVAMRLGRPVGYSCEVYSIHRRRKQTRTTGACSGELQ